MSNYEMRNILPRASNVTNQSAKLKRSIQHDKKTPDNVLYRDMGSPMSSVLGPPSEFHHIDDVFDFQEDPPVFRSVCIGALPEISSQTDNIKASNLKHSVSVPSWSSDFAHLGSESKDYFDVGDRATSLDGLSLSKPSLLPSELSFYESSSPFSTDPMFPGAFSDFGTSSLFQPTSVGQMESKNISGSTPLKNLVSLVSKPLLSLMPKMLPDYLEPNAHFICSKPIKTLIVDIGKFLDHSKVGFTFQQDDCMFACDSFAHFKVLHFNIYIYTAPITGFMVEFQRRSGNCVQFANIYGHASQEITQETTNENYHPTPKVPEMFDDPPTIKMCDKPSERPPMLQNLSDMACSDYGEDQYEGSSLLAYLSSKDQNCPPMIGYGALNTLHKCLVNGKDYRAQRCAAAAVANMISGRSQDEISGVQIVLQSIMAALVALLLISPRMEIIREAARALVALSQMNIHSVDLDSPESSDKFHRILKRLEETRDETTIGYRDCLLLSAPINAQTHVHVR